MTGCACDRSILTVIEREGMIETGRLPSLSIMTGAAVGSITARVSIPGGMAGITILGCTREHTVPVAIIAGHIGMRPAQWE